MPMPILDPDVFVDARLADPTHKLPLPDKGGRHFSAEGEKVNRYDPFYAALIADGSLVLDAAEAEAAARPAAADPAPPAAPTDAA